MVERVRVTGPPRHTARRPDVDRSREVRDQADGADGGVGEVYLRSLLRAQLALAVRVLTLLGLGLGALPLLFHLAPELAERTVLGLPVAWVLLGVLVHPFLLVLAWRYVRRAERNERVFADLVGGADTRRDAAP